MVALPQGGAEMARNYFIFLRIIRSCPQQVKLGSTFEAAVPTALFAIHPLLMPTDRGRLE